MLQSQIQLIIHSKFAGFTMTRLDKRYDILTNIIADPDSSSTEIMIAAQERAEVEACIQLFIAEDVDDEWATPALILEAVTGISMERLKKQTPGGALAQDLLDKTTTITKATVEGTRKGVNKFATWLAEKTEASK